MKKVVCSQCKGRKKILGLGLMEKECPNCNNEGYVQETVKNRDKSHTKKKD